MSKIIDKYILQNSVGSGQYGKVYKAFHIDTNEVVAIKVIKLERFKQVPKLADFTINEVKTLQQIRNTNIIGFVEMLRTVNNIYLVYQFCNGGNLEELIHKTGFIKEPIALEYFAQLLNGFEVMSQLNILHRDLKPTNILLHNDQIKIADFGFCKTLAGPMDLAQTMVGSPIYMAPEILLGEPYTLTTDIWSLGVTLFEMLFGRCPFEENTIPKLMFQIQHKTVEIPHHIQKISEVTEWLLRRMLTVDPAKRITSNELFEVWRVSTTQPIPLKQPELKAQVKSLEVQKYQSQRTRTLDSNYQKEARSKTPTRAIDPLQYQRTSSNFVSTTPPRFKQSPPRFNKSPSRFNKSPQRQCESSNVKPVEAKIQLQQTTRTPKNPDLELSKRSAHQTTSPKFIKERGKSPIDPRFGSTNNRSRSPLPKQVQPYSSHQGSLKTNQIQNIKWNLRALMQKRCKLIDWLTIVDHVLEINDRQFAPMISFIIIQHVGNELKQMEGDLCCTTQPDQWDIVGLWSDFIRMPQCQRCLVIVQNDVQRLNQMNIVFRKDIQSIQDDRIRNPLEVDSYTKKQTTMECFDYVDTLWTKLYQNESNILQHFREMIKFISELINYTPKFVNYIQNNQDQNKLNQYLIQMKAHVITQ